MCLDPAGFSCFTSVVTVLGANVSIPNNTASAVLAWCENFATVVSADPAAYDLDAATAADVVTVTNDLRAAFDTAGVESRMAVNPGGYTQPNRAALSAARAAALSFIRPLAFEIHANDAISSEDKLAAGVVPRNFNRSPIFVPQSAPILGFQFASMGSHVLSFADSTTPASKRKPFGASGMQLFVAIGSGVQPLSEARYFGTFTRNPAVVTFDQGDAGKVATYFARWIGKRGDEGPWSAALDAIVMFSNLGAAS